MKTINYSSDNKNKSGMTLVELMVCVAIVGLVVGMSLTAFIAFSQSAAGSTGMSEMHSDVRHSLDIMTRDIHMASDVMAFNSVTGIQLYQLTETGPKTVLFVVSGGTLIRIQDGQKYVMADGVQLNMLLFDRE